MFKRLFYWLKRLFRNELPHKEQVQIAKPKSEDPPWLRIAKAEIGTTEIPGPENSKRVLEYHLATSLKASDDSVAWCSSFVNWCFKEAGIKGSGKANARSWLNWGYPMKAPGIGCVVIFWRVSPKSWKGHIGLYVGEDDKYIYCLGGNQSNMVRVSKYSKERLLGYRWPVISDTI